MELDTANALPTPLRGLGGRGGGGARQTDMGKVNRNAGISMRGSAREKMFKPKRNTLKPSLTRTTQGS